jgi:hypothetical protein
MNDLFLPIVFVILGMLAIVALSALLSWIAGPAAALVIAILFWSNSSKEDSK